MIVYVETNFFLELALKQEEYTFAQQIVETATRGHIHLRFPAFSAMEPLWTVISRGKQRKSIHQALRTELGQLGRSANYVSLVSLMKRMTQELIDIERKDMDNLEETFLQLFKVGVPIDLTRVVYETSLHYQKEYDFSPQDAIVYASIITHLTKQSKEERKIYVSRNWKDFDQSDIRNELNEFSCRYFSSFEAAAGYMKSQL